MYQKLDDQTKMLRPFKLGRSVSRAFPSLFLTVCQLSHDTKVQLCDQMNQMSLTLQMLRSASFSSHFGILIIIYNVLFLLFKNLVVKLLTDSLQRRKVTPQMGVNTQEM